MATSNRKPKALLDAEKEIERLKKELAGITSSKDMWYKEAQTKIEELEGLHNILTDLGIREYKDETQRYNRLPLTVRLFAWAMRTSERVAK